MDFSENTKEEGLSLYEIIILACFISLVFSPVGLFLMWWKFKSGRKCKWSLKAKIIVSASFFVLYILMILLAVFLNASPSAGSGNGVPFFGMEQEYDVGGGGSGDTGSYKPKKSSSKAKGSGSNQTQTQFPQESFMEKAGKSRVTYILIFVVIMLALIVWRNLKSGTSRASENPYVDTTKYKIPVPDGFEFPQVHYTKIALQDDEKILYATTAEQKTNTGDIVVTNKRFLFVSKKDALDFQLGELSSISSMSNTALLVNAGGKSYYFFVQDTQMRFVLQITRWAYEKKYGGDAE
ncbi:MAG: PH domain-containing protein [Treponema sp.]|nr:PH domain-containing protein [Treponema sp.]